VAKVKASSSSGAENHRERIIPKLKGAGMYKNARLTMTIPEFAELTGCSKNLAYSLARQGKLPVPVIHLGAKRMCVPRKAVMELLGLANKDE
jgi:excisionase family DNA binding protein